MSHSGSQAARQPLNRVAFERIRRDIIHCTLEPGRQVTEAQLAARYELGKAPIRAALLGLCQEGLVRAIPRRGYLITPVTMRDAQDIFQLRMLLEPTAGAPFRRARDECAAAALSGRPCSVRCKPGDASMQPAVDAHRELHLTIAHASGNQRLEDALTRLYDDVERLVHLGVSRIDSEEMAGYRPLVSALAAGDGDLAARLMIEQIELGRKRILEALLSSSVEGAVDIRRRTPAESMNVEELAGRISALLPEANPADVPLRVAEILPPLLRNSLLLSLEQRESSLRSYRSHSLYADPEGRFSILAVVWEAGQATPVHDQTCWTVIGVYDGELRKTLYRHLEGSGSAARLVPTGVTHYHKGDVTYAAGSELHRWDNPAGNVVISIQVYGAAVPTSGSAFGQCYLPDELRQ